MLHDVVHGFRAPPAPLGQEQQHTLRWIGPGKVAREYHCDYLWLSDDLQPALLGGGVGSMADWIDTGLSDHVPVWADLAR